MTVRSYLVPKDSTDPVACEDAFSVGGQRVAVADGASSDAFSGLWARLLVEGWTELGTLDLAERAACWKREVGAQPLPWFLADKVRQGAHAAFLGLSINPDQTFAATACGDCCLFHIRDEALKLAFPITHPDDLGGHPLLLPTHTTPPPLQTVTGDWLPGDHFYLMSDALAGWFLHSVVVQQHRPWSILRKDDLDLAKLVENLQRTQRIVKDDVVLLVVSDIK